MVYGEPHFDFLVFFLCAGQPMSCVYTDVSIQNIFGRVRNLRINGEAENSWLNTLEVDIIGGDERNEDKTL